jgi:hypothetical protein
MCRSIFKFVNNSPFGAALEDRPETHDPDRDRSVFHLLLDVESRLRKQAREESKIDYAKRRIFGQGEACLKRSNVCAPTATGRHAIGNGTQGEPLGSC